MPTGRCRRFRAWLLGCLVAFCLLLICLFVWSIVDREATEEAMEQVKHFFGATPIDGIEAEMQEQLDAATDVLVRMDPILVRALSAQAIASVVLEGQVREDAVAAGRGGRFGSRAASLSPSFFPSLSPTSLLRSPSPSPSVRSRERRRRPSERVAHALCRADDFRPCVCLHRGRLDARLARVRASRRASAVVFGRRPLRRSLRR